MARLLVISAYGDGGGPVDLIANLEGLAISSAAIGVADAGRP
jgi:hypothetical protein